MKIIILVFLTSIISAGFLIWITVIHNKVNELVDEINKIKQAQMNNEKNKSYMMENKKRRINNE